MKNLKKWSSLLVLLLGVLMVVGLVACGERPQSQTASGREEIINYIDKMLPVMERHADWFDDQNALSQERGLTYEEGLYRLRELSDRMEQIYLDVEKSIPPPVLRNYKHKWSQVCQLNLQSVTLAIQIIQEGNTALLTQLNEVTFRANDLKTEADEELIDILAEHDIPFNP